MRHLKDQVAVITGAAGGIGRQLAAQLAAAGCHLALVDLHEDRLEALAATLGDGVRVSIHVLDVRDIPGLERLAEEVREVHGDASLVIPAAGATVWGTFADHSPYDIDWAIDLNLRGAVHTCRVFLPQLRARAATGEAHVVLFSSLQAMFGVPMQSMYVASKYALRGFSASLRAELGVEGIGVTAVLPGAVKGPFMGNGRSHDEGATAEMLPIIARVGTSPRRVAAATLQGIRRNRAEVVVGLDARGVSLLRWLVPPLIPSLVGWSMRVFTPEGRRRR